MKTNSLYLFLLLCVGWIFSSCASPNKKKEDVGFLGRAYQNTTAYYNGYFNANELLDQVLLESEKRNPDNYQEQLTLFPLLLDTDSTTSVGPLNTAIDKLKKDIGLHPASHWVDDAYFKLGFAQFLKKDFESAENSLRYVVENYSPEKLHKEKMARKSPAARKKAVAKQRDIQRTQTAAARDSERPPKVSKKEREKQKKVKEKTREQEKKERLKANKKAKKEREKAKKQAAKARKKGKKPANAPRPAQKTEVKTEVVTAEPPAKKATVNEPPKRNTQPAKNTNSKKTQQKDVAEVVPDEVTDKDGVTKEYVPPTEPNKYFLKHRPVYQQAQLWLARTYLVRGNSTDGDRILRDLKSDPATFDFIRREVLLSEAHAEMARNNPSSAIPKIETALEMTKPKKQKARLAYILGQLYAGQGNYNMAASRFEMVEDLKPGYEMTFNAKLAGLHAAMIAGNITDSELTATLNKMLRDQKNLEYRDQIYFTLADIHLKNNEINAGIANLQKGLAVSQKGPQAKAESYLKLADLFYERDRFDMAYHYYDSTSSGYSPTKERYKEIIYRRDHLQDIAFNLEIIAQQDSLLRISRMSAEEQEALAKGMIKDKREQDRISANTTAAGGSNTSGSKYGGNISGAVSGPGTSNRPGGLAAGPKPSTFFAYNEKQLKDGKKTFEKTWGKRPLVDNWRVSSMMDGFEGQDFKEEESAVATLFISKSEIESVLKDIPKDEATTKAVEAKIIAAMASLGELYPDKIDRYDKSIEVLEEMLRRFPGSRYEPQAYYLLYFAYQVRGDQTKADYYAQLLVSKYSGNQYAIYFQDPDYIKSLNEKGNELENYYTQTYDSLSAGNYSSAYHMSLRSDTLFGLNNIMRPKFLMISAMCIGNINGKEAYIAALKDIILRYPGSDEEKRAKEMMRLLGSGADEKDQLLVDAAKIYKQDVKDQHFVMVILKAGQSNISDVKVELSEFNNKNFLNAGLKIANISIKDSDGDRQVLLIRSFDGKIKSMEYYNQARNKKGEFVSAKFPHDLYVISNANYREFLRSKNIEMYEVWFTKYYRNM